MARAWLGWVTSMLLVACGPPDTSAIPDSTEGSTGDSGSSGATSTGVGESSSDTGEPPSWEQPPSCEGLVLPGDPMDVAATPRADRDAEILALGLAPELVVARQDRYDVIAADLAAIRELRPELADVHAECEIPYGYAFWADDANIVGAVWLGFYHAWDCHNAFYGIEHNGVEEGGGDVWRIDGYAFAMEVSGVFASSFVDAYRTLPGLENVSISPYWTPRDGFAYDCEPTGGSVSLDATFDAAGELDDRTYTFVHPELGAAVYLVTPGGQPMQVG